MSEFRKFNVVPVLPEKLAALSLISENLWYCWNHEAFRLFKDIDAELWHSARHNPVAVLKEVDQERLNTLAEDSRFLAKLNTVARKMDAYLKSGAGNSENGHRSIAYFSAEYGLTDAIPVYSGGLGVLSGDHIKSASDLNLNLVGIGLLYQEGYFQQKLDKNGWQQDYYRVNDFSSMPMREVTDENGSPRIVEIVLAERPVFLKIWRIDAGRVPIFMLDSNIDRNSDTDKKLTAHLYGGDREHRLKQEIALGIGGMRALKALGIEPEVVHVNEGHSAFALFERAVQISDKYSLDINSALELSRKSSVFTTHTPVPAGNDEFSADLIKKYFAGYLKKPGLTVEEFIRTGADPGNGYGSVFSMTVAAIRNSAYVNGVSELHGDVAAKMWNHLWADTPVEHTPVRSITNGIHLQSWISREMKDLLNESLGENWAYRKSNGELHELVKKIPDEKIWNIRRIRKAKLISYSRMKINEQYRDKGIFNYTAKEIGRILEPDALTIGFARRFASYKRGDLIFRDEERLKKILSDPERPVQIIIAGKAHPQDNPGKEIIKRISGIINSADFRSRVVFLENYNINIGRYLVQGVDLWLNNPIRMFEASGTSGMKAVVNGGLNLSILDGWWDEGFNGENGWAVGERIPMDDPEFRDDVESDSLYSVLEEEIIPLFFDRNTKGVPLKWIEKVKNSIATLAPRFNTYRMVSDYNDMFYCKAADNYRKLKADRFRLLTEYSDWKKHIRENFAKIIIRGVDYDQKPNFRIGEKLKVSVTAGLGDLDPSDIKVEVYLGRIERDDRLKTSALFPLDHIENSPDGGSLFAGSIPFTETGNLGFKVRITPNHELLTDSMELNLVKWG